MKKYFYSKGDTNQGPFSLEELKLESITNKSLIWFEGLEDWKEAKDFEELNELFESTPSSTNINNEQIQSSDTVLRKSKHLNYLIWFLSSLLYSGFNFKLAEFANEEFLIASVLGYLFGIFLFFFLFGALFFGLISIFKKANFSKVLAWTSVIWLVMFLLKQFL